MCLLNTNTFQCICWFWELATCLLNTDCLLNRGGSKTGFNVDAFSVYMRSLMLCIFDKVGRKIGCTELMHAVSAER